MCCVILSYIMSPVLMLSTLTVLHSSNHDSSAVCLQAQMTPEDPVALAATRVRSLDSVKVFCSYSGKVHAIVMSMAMAVTGQAVRMLGTTLYNPSNLHLQFWNIIVQTTDYIT